MWHWTHDQSYLKMQQCWLFIGYNVNDVNKLELQNGIQAHANYYKVANNTTIKTFVSRTEVDC